MTARSYAIQHLDDKPGHHWDSFVHQGPLNVGDVIELGAARWYKVLDLQPSRAQTGWVAHLSEPAPTEAEAHARTSRR